MCGINGIFAYEASAPQPRPSELVATRDFMRARGPDGSGAWWSEDRRLGFGHRRLSIIDLSDRAAQPMISADGRYVVTFNGEIYNHVALRRKLEARGRQFRTTSDTEVLLHLFAMDGEEMVHHLRGMFAFAIWDAVEQVLFLARDPHGIKPLYYADDGRTFRFASQVKALMAGGAIPQTLEPAGLVGFCLFGSVPDPFTIYQAVRAIPAGTTLRVTRSGVCKPRRYFNWSRVLAEAVAAGPLTPRGKMQDIVKAALLDSVHDHLVADVPVGVFLSGGIDSATIAGLASERLGGIASVTLGFEEFRGHAEDEVPQAVEIARHFDTAHSVRMVGREEFEAEVPRFFAAMDQPTIDGVNTWFVSKALRERGLKVALSGLGGDELFGGYPSFRDIPRWVNAMRVPSQVPGLGAAFRNSSLAFNRLIGGLKPKVPGAVQYGGTYPGAYLLRRGLFMPWELPELLGDDVAREGLARLDPLKLIGDVLSPDPVQPFARVAALEASLYMGNQLLRDADWSSMAHSIEVRVPLVDGRLAKSLAPILVDDGRPAGKELLAESVRKTLPLAILARQKTGFMTPVSGWIEATVAAQKPDSVGRSGTRPHWSRRWAGTVLAEFVPERSPPRPAPRRRTAELQQAS